MLTAHPNIPFYRVYFDCYQRLLERPLNMLQEHKWDFPGEAAYSITNQREQSASILHRILNGREIMGGGICPLNYFQWRDPILMRGQNSLQSFEILSIAL
jgi:hypothetical protein